MARRRGEQLNVVSVPDRVYRVLQHRILEGELEAGTRVHQENISAELGVSRTPVREALARLAADGLVELVPNRGARVAGVALEDMRMSYEARLGLEPMAARLAAERRTPSDLERMKTAVERQRSARSPRTSFAAIREFHHAVIAAASSPLLERFATSVWSGRTGLQVYLKQAEPQLLEDDVSDHERLVAAIEDGDAARAERLMREHLEVSLQRLLAAEHPPVPLATQVRRPGSM